MDHVGVRGRRPPPSRERAGPAPGSGMRPRAHAVHLQDELERQAESYVPVLIVNDRTPTVPAVGSPQLTTPSEAVEILPPTGDAAVACDRQRVPRSS
jgi:hypothetical protein